MPTKHDRIMQYIEELPVGERISVRSIAKNLEVSEGTAYRAIKDAEMAGLVSTIQRVGTIRIERKVANQIEKLTYGDIVQIIEGDILGGHAGLDKVLNKFVIGAMTEEAMLRYITPDSLVIVGNREDAQKLALSNGAAVLITGGFSTSEEIINLSNQLGMPVLGTSYDTFTVATMINRAMSDQLIKKDIMLVGDIYVNLEHTNYLYTEHTVMNYRQLSEETEHSRFPVVNKSNRLIGIVTAKDILGKPDTQSLDKVMTKNPRYVKKHMSVASVEHIMVWDGLEIMPVVEDDLTLVGIISRQDVMKAMQLAQRQPQVANTIADQIAGELIQNDTVTDIDFKKGLTNFQFTVSPQMINGVGTISFGVLSEIIALVTERTMTIHCDMNVIIEQMNLLYFKLIQMESLLDIRPVILEMGRRSVKLDIEVYLDNGLVAKSIVICRLMEQ